MARRPIRGNVLPGVRPNAGIAASYRKRITALIDEMARSYEWWIRAQYRATPPKMAMDAMSSKELERLLKEMGIKWTKRFESAAPKLALFFLRSVQMQSRRDLKRILKDAGISVPMTEMSPKLRDIMRAEIAENTSLIKSIPAQYHTQVEGLVMRSVASGRDLKSLTDDLHQRYGITRRRAAFIAFDQNQKATSAIQRERQTAVGLTEGIWMHSTAGKTPRPTHVANNGKRFNLKEGWFDPDVKVRRHIWPGMLINCRCVWRPIVPGFS